MDYYYFDEYGELFDVQYFETEEQAEKHCDEINACTFCVDNYEGE